MESSDIIDRFLAQTDLSWGGVGTLTADDHVRQVDESLARGLDCLRSLQVEEEYWIAPLDSNMAINAEYILFQRFMGLVDGELDRQLANHILANQHEDGSWGIYYGGPGTVSVSVLCYFALKMAGLSADDPRMARARHFILQNGGIGAAPFECKYLLALFGQFHWKGLPHLPVYLVLAPKWFPVSIYQISYWTRTSLIPMAVLYDKRTMVELPKELWVDELYVDPNDRHRFGGNVRTFSVENVFLQAGKAMRLLDFLTFRTLNRLGLKKTKEWILSHQDDSGDWGGIYPAMMYSLMALKQMGMPMDDPRMLKGIEALKRFQIPDGRGGILQQACVSPIWDTAWSILALRESGVDSKDRQVKPAAKWLLRHQIFRKGDWAVREPHVEPGGWCFQFYNDFYPDLDDTAVVLMSLQTMMDEFTESEREAYRKGTKFLLSLQNDDGGWAAFEKNVNREIINHLPVNDIRNMLDPSTSDVTGRVVEMLGSIGFTTSHPAVQKAIRFLISEQEPMGGWFGRWGVNYIYGTWSVLTGLARVGEDMQAQYVRKAVAWLKGLQNEDGGWGESCKSYEDPEWIGRGTSTASQTAWGLTALVAAGEADSPEARRGAAYLIERQAEDGHWDEKEFTGTGFPCAFYLRYHYYSLYFPLIALGRYRNAL